MMCVTNMPYYVSISSVHCDEWSPHNKICTLTYNIIIIIFRIHFYNHFVGWCCFTKGTNIWGCIQVSILHLKNTLYLFYHLILQLIQYFNFYFYIQLIKIIYTRQKHHFGPYILVAVNLVPVIFNLQSIWSLLFIH